MCVCVCGYPSAVVSQQCRQVPLHAVHARLSLQYSILGLRTYLGKEDVSLSGLSAITALASDAVIKGNSARAQIMTVICWRTYLIVYSDGSECCVLLGLACMSNATSLCVYFSLLAGLLQLRALTCLSIRFRELRISFELTYLYSFLYSYMLAFRQKSWRSLPFNSSPNIQIS